MQTDGRQTVTLCLLLNAASIIMHKQLTKQYVCYTACYNKYVHLWGRPYIHTCRSYVHTPRELDRHVVESPTGTFIVLHALADWSDFGLLWSKVPENVRFPPWDADKPPCKI